LWSPAFLLVPSEALPAAKVVLRGTGARVSDGRLLPRCCRVTGGGYRPFRDGGEHSQWRLRAATSGAHVPPKFVTAERVYAFGTAEPYGATRFSF